MLLLLSHLLLAQGSYASMHLDPIPAASANFVSSADSRGTLDILWSCLFALIICAAAIEHLNLPKQRNEFVEAMERRHHRKRDRGKGNDLLARLWYTASSAARGRWDEVRLGVPDIGRSLKWMLFSMLAPEFMLGKAIGDFVAARELRDKMREFALRDNVEWGLSHGFLANMGGFRVVVEEEDMKEGAGPRRETPESQTVIHTSDPGSGAGGRSGGQHPGPASEANPEIDAPATAASYILSGEDIFKLRQLGAIKRVPEITQAEIRDRENPKAFTKVLAVVQVFWMTLQVIVRGTESLAISQLELVALGFSLCTIISSLFLVRKPQGVRTPMPPIKVSSQYAWWIRTPNWEALRDFTLPHVLTVPINENTYPTTARIPNDFICRFTLLGETTPYALGMALGGVLFGAVHIAAWNFTFPTIIEREIWRISSIISTISLPVAFVPRLVSPVEENLLDECGCGWYSTTRMCWLVFEIPFAVARLYLLVETFRTLAYLPPDAFVSTWVQNVPHFG